MLENVEMNQQIESEKQEIDKLLIEIRETKETLIKFNEDLEKAIAAECHIRQLIDHSVESWISVLANHRSEQTRLITEHEANMRKILRRNEGVWYSDFWMKVLVIFLLVYTMGLGLVVYCIT